MGKFKERDLIVLNDEFYLCEIAGEEESVFVKASINVGSYCTGATESGIVIPSDTNKFLKQVENGNYKYFACAKRFNNVVRNPIIGKVAHELGLGVLLDLSALRFNSPKAYSDLITKAFNALPENKKECSLEESTQEKTEG